AGAHGGVRHDLVGAVDEDYGVQLGVDFRFHTSSRQGPDGGLGTGATAEGSIVSPARALSIYDSRSDPAARRAACSPVRLRSQRGGGATAGARCSGAAATGAPLGARGGGGGATVRAAGEGDSELARRGPSELAARWS